jgi:hypothetical protein
MRRYRLSRNSGRPAGRPGVSESSTRLPRILEERNEQSDGCPANPVGNSPEGRDVDPSVALSPPPPADAESSPNRPGLRSAVLVVDSVAEPVQFPGTWEYPAGPAGLP